MEHTNEIVQTTRVIYKFSHCSTIRWTNESILKIVQGVARWYGFWDYIFLITLTEKLCFYSFMSHTFIMIIVSGYELQTE